MTKWMRMGSVAGLLLTGWLLVAAGAGAAPASVRNQIESSLLVTGTVDIEPDGSVSKVAIEREDRLPPGVVSFVRDAGLQWRFEPVVRDGQAVRARAPMSVRVVAQKVEKDEYRITLRGASFERYDPEDPERVVSIKMDPPAYPERAWRAGAGGSVYLVLKIGRDGRVQDAVAEQVNLRVAVSEGEMRRLRDELARSALAATGKWSFRVPTRGEAVDAPYWSVRVPVTYTLGTQPIEGKQGAYGKWISYIPGPRQPVPWAQDRDQAGFSPDTLADGGVYMADGRAPRLLTPLQGG